MAREWRLRVYAVRYDRLDALPGDPPLFLARKDSSGRHKFTSLASDMAAAPAYATTLLIARVPTFPGYVATFVPWAEAMLWAEAALDQLAGRPSDSARRAEENAARDAAEGIRELLNFQPTSARRR